MNVETNSTDKYLFSIPTATEKEFKNSMIEMIKHNFADLLNEEDIKLLEKGNEGLTEVANKFHKKYDERFKNLKKFLQ